MNKKLKKIYLKQPNNRELIIAIINFMLCIILITNYNIMINYFYEDSKLDSFPFLYVISLNFSAMIFPILINF